MGRVIINIRNLRLYTNKNNLTQSELATKMGVSRQRINQFFNSDIIVTHNTIEKIALILKIDASKIIQKNYEPVSEKKIQKSILDYLKQRGYWCIKFIPSRFSTSGISDIIACQPDTGKFVGIEVKRHGCSATKIQQLFLSTISNLGGIAFVAMSVDDVKKQI